MPIDLEYRKKQIARAKAGEITLDECKRLVRVRESGVLDEREHGFSGKAALLQVFVCDGQIEAFVDGHSSLSAAGLLRSEGLPAIEIIGGPATIHRPLLHYFKRKQDR